MISFSFLLRNDGGWRRRLGGSVSSSYRERCLPPPEYNEKKNKNSDNRRCVRSNAVLVRSTRRSLVETRTGQRGQLRRRQYHELIYAQTSENPFDVLTYSRSSSSFPSPPPPPTMEGAGARGCWVLVRLYAAPWNPADLNTIQGKYPSPSHLFSHLRNKCRTTTATTTATEGDVVVVAGSEGLGKVLQVWRSDDDDDDDDDNQQTFRPGEWVVLGLPGLGSYRSHIWVPSQALLRLFSNQQQQQQQQQGNTTTTTTTTPMTPYGVCQWSTLLQLGGTAWRLLNDYYHHPRTEDGDSAAVVVIQNAARSNVGYMVRQLLPIVHPKKSHLINVIRGGDIPQQQQPNASTENNNNRNIFVREEDLEQCRNTREMWHCIVEQQHQQVPVENGDDIPKPSLALDSVAGSSGSRLLQLLRPSGGGVLVNYGALSKQPISIAAPHLIFQNKRVQGYWHSRWMEQTSVSIKQSMLDALVGLVQSGHISLPPVRPIPLASFSETVSFKDKDKDDSRISSHDPTLPSLPKIVLDLYSRSSGQHVVVREDGRVIENDTYDPHTPLFDDAPEA